MRLIRDLILIVIVASGGVGASQVPSFVNQVEQRLGGTLDEATRLLDQFRAVAVESNMTFDGYIDWMVTNEDARIRRTGERVRDLRLRVADLRRVRAELARAPHLIRPVIVARQVDLAIVEAAWADYRPSLTLDSQFGTVGLLLGWLIFGVGSRTGRAASRIVAPPRSPRPRVEPSAGPGGTAGS